jgi:hypothetical protein
MSKIKGYIISHKYNGRDTTNNPYIYPKLETQEDIFNFINRVVLPSGKLAATPVASEIIAFFKARYYAPCNISDINIAMGLEAKKPKVAFNKHVEGKKPVCPYGRISFTIRKFKAAGLIQSENIGRFSTMSFNKDLWDSFSAWLINRAKNNF